MGKINYFALFGVLFFNIVLFSGIAITLVALLFSFWTVVASFILSPILLLIVDQMGIQESDNIQTILSFILFAVGIGLAPLAMKTTRYLGEFFAKYIQYNKKVVYAK